MSAVSKNWQSSWSVFKRAIGVCFSHFWLSLILLVIQVLVTFLIEGGVILLAKPLGDDLFSLGILPKTIFILFALFYQTVFILVAMRMAKQSEGSKQMHSFWKRFFPVLGLLAVLILGISLGGLLFVIPGIILFVYWSMALPILVYEATSIRVALKQSYRLVKGAGWAVFNRFVFIAGLEVLISALAIVPSVGFFLSTMLTICLGLVTFVYMALIYEDLLVVKSTQERSVLQYTSGKKVLLILWALFVFLLLPLFNSLGDFVARIYANGSPNISNVEISS